MPKRKPNHTGVYWDASHLLSPAAPWCLAFPAAPWGAHWAQHPAAALRGSCPSLTAHTPTLRERLQDGSPQKTAASLFLAASFPINYSPFWCLFLLLRRNKNTQTHRNNSLVRFRWKLPTWQVCVYKLKSKFHLNAGQCRFKKTSHTKKITHG